MKHSPLTEREALHIFQGMLKSVQKVKELGFIQNQVTPVNFWINGTGKNQEVVLSNTGLPGLQTEYATKEKVADDSKVTDSLDHSWALGIILY